MALGFLGKSMKKLGYPGLSNSTLGSVGGDTFYPNWLPNLAAWYDLNNTSSYITGTGVKLLGDLSGNSGTNVLALNGVPANNASTPDSAATSPTGDMDIKMRLFLQTWTPAANVSFVYKGDNAWATDKQFVFYIAGSGALSYATSANGTTSTGVTSTVSVPFGVLTAGWVRVTRRASDGRIQFFTGPDGPSEPTWTQLGADRTGATGTLFDSASALRVSDPGGNFAGAINGNVYYMQLSGTIDGAATVKFDPSTASKLASSFVSSTGETWTINTTGDLGARICLARDLVNLTGATQPTLSGGGMRCTAASSQYMRCAQWNGAQPLTRFSVIQQVAWSAGKYLLDGAAGANTGAVIQTTSTPQINLSAGTSVAANTNMAVGSNAILTQIINGASSSLQVNNTAATTGNAGAGAANGLTVGANGAATAASFSDTILYEHLSYTASLDVPSQQRVIQYLSKKWGIPV